MKPLGIYIHIPFCEQKCAYCDFLSFGGFDREFQNRYIDALLLEIEEGNYTRHIVDGGGDLEGTAEYQVDSVFIGGGTPSLLESCLIKQVLDKLRTCFVISDDAEITIEANPKTVDKEKLREYRASGINRISMGAQSFEPVQLQFLRRIHTAEDFRTNFAEARDAGFQNCNIDLMFGIPGQTSEMWEHTLSEALALEPEHLSFYSLQLEEGTPLFRMWEKGEFEIPEDGLNREMYHTAIERLKELGYLHYEVSNAAKPGFACRHNLKYWSMEDYLGLGLGAHSFLNGVRFSNTDRMEEYLESPGGICGELHHNTRQDEISEYIFTGMRKLSGIDLTDFRMRFGLPIQELFGEQIETLMNRGLIELGGSPEPAGSGMRCGDDGQRAGSWMRFTPKGIDISNTVLVEFV